MAPSFDYAATSLLCAEDNDSLMCFDDYDYGAIDDEVEGSVWNHENYNQNQNPSFSLNEDFSLMGFSLHNEESIGLLIQKESQHFPENDYLGRLESGDLDLGMRREAVEWISKVHAHYGFGPLSAYLSITYLDRFLSAYELPKGKAWMIQLAAVGCLSVAAKMEETDVPLSLDFQVGGTKFVFEARTIQRMELLLLSTLKWRMQAVTPFSFLDYFLWKFNDDQPPHRSSISRSIDLILGTVQGVDYLKFRPSEVAAAVAIFVLKETKAVGTDNAAAYFIHVQKDRVEKCIEMIQDVSMNSGSFKVPSNAPVSYVPMSPIGVLDAACLSYKSDELAVGSCANSSHSSPEAKKRKLNPPSEVEMKS